MDTHESFHIFKRGKLTIIGFEAKHLDNCNEVADCRDRLLEIADSHACEILVVDLMDVGIISSWVLGVLAAVQKRGIEVHLYHPSKEIRGVLDATRLHELMKVRGVS